jgi:hypothetical protein
MVSIKSSRNIFFVIWVLVWLYLAMPVYAIDDIGDDSSPILNQDTPYELPQQILPALDNTTYLYYFESDDALLTPDQPAKRYSFGTLPDEKVTLLVYGLDDLVMPQLALYNAEGELVRQGTRPLNPYITGLEFEAGDKELFFFEVAAENNATGVVRVMLFEGDPYDDDLTLLDTINPLLPGRAFLVAGDHIDAAIDGLNVRVEVLPVPRFEDDRPEVFASRGTEAQYPSIDERFTPDVQRGWANTADVPIYTINVRAAPEPLSSVTELISYNKSLNLNTFFYFEYHLIIGKGSVPQLLLRGDDCQSNPNRPECIRSTGEPTGRGDATTIVPVRNDPPPPEVVLVLPPLPTIGDTPPPFVFEIPTVTFDCALANPDVDINIINGTDANDIIGGTGCRERILAGGGNDSIDGSIRSDELFGEDGDDFFFDWATDSVYFFSNPADNDFFDGGAGIDTLQVIVPASVGTCFGFFCEIATYTATVNYGGGLAGNVLINENYVEQFFIFPPFINIDTLQINTFQNMENISTSGNTNELFNITPDNNNNIFNAGAGTDTISYAAYGADITFDVSSTTSVITTPANAGFEDTPYNFEIYNGGSGVDTVNIINTSNFDTIINGINVNVNLPDRYNTGEGDDEITLRNIGDRAVTIDGGIGNDVITVERIETNIDTLIGGTGVDTLIYNATALLPNLPALFVDYNAGGNGEIRNNATNALLDIFQDMDNITTDSDAGDVFSIEFDGLNNEFRASGALNDFNDGDTADFGATATGITFTLNAAESFTATQGMGATDTLFSFETLIGTAANDTFNITRADYFQPTFGNGIQGGGGDDIFNITPEGFGLALFDGGTNTLVGDTININDPANTGIEINYAATGDFSITVSGETDDARNFENITTAAAADEFFVAADAVNNTFDGAGGVDTFTATTAVTFNIGATTTVVGGGGTDTLLNIENVVGSAGNDIFNIDIEATGTPITLNGGMGNNLFVFNGVADAANGTRTITITNMAGGANWLSFNGITGAGLTIDMNSLVQNQFGTFVINLNAVMTRLIGTNQADTITGTAGNDIIDAAGGNDSVDGNPGSDIIYGGLGDDDLDGDDISGVGGGNDVVYGGAACAGLNTPAGSYILAVPANSADGDDMIVGGTGSDILYGGNNNSAEANANNCDDGVDRVSDPNNGDADILYGGNNNTTAGADGTDANDLLVSVDESGNGAEDTAFAGNNNTGGGTGTDGAGDTAVGDVGDTLGNGNNPP